MLGTIELERVPAHCIVGILPRERVEPQTIFLDVSLDIDFAAAAASESVEDTVDYAALADALEALVVEGRFQLIETMAERCAEHVLSEHPAVQRVRMVVHKPAAVPRAADTRVRVERSR
jgi:dihydroneopterin aldolase